jgi:hypothetical protein
VASEIDFAGEIFMENDCGVGGRDDQVMVHDGSGRLVQDSLLAKSQPGTLKLN